MEALRIAGMRGLYRLAYRLMQVRTILLRRPGRGVKCLLTHGDELLLVRHTYGPRGTWQLPGGLARRGEQPVLTASREMGEELGLRDLRLRELRTLEMRLEHMVVHLTAVHAELAGPTVAPNPVEIADARWFALDDLPAPLGVEVEPLLDLLFERA
jgi:NAD+ diphosphatase